MTIPALDDLLGPAVDPRQRRRIEAALEPVTLRAGEVLFARGAAGDAMYFLASGRLAVSFGDGAPPVEVGRGAVVGEMALVSNRPRSATISALRTSRLLRLSAASFRATVTENPSLIWGITTQLVDRLRTRQFGTPAPSRIGILSLVDADSTAAMVDSLAQAVERLGHAVVVCDAGATESTLADAERDSAFVLIPADPDDQDRVGGLPDEVDSVVILCNSRRSPPPPLLQLLASTSTSVEIAAVGPPGTALASWIRTSMLDARIHRLATHTEVDRLARLITGAANVAVFSGGGARSVAHRGVVRAMADLDLPLDAVLGTSGGAVAAAAVASGRPLDEWLTKLEPTLQLSWRDFTAPEVALTNGRRLTRAVREVAGNTRIEELPLSFACVSTSLTRGEAHLHRRGPLWRALRATMSVPLLLPPMVEDDEVLVDGALTDNMPVAFARRLHPGSRIIAVDVGRSTELVPGDLPVGGEASGWRLVGRGGDHPSLGDLMARLSEVVATRTSDDTGDVVIRPDVGAVGSLDYSTKTATEQAGYEAASEALGNG